MLQHVRQQLQYDAFAMTKMLLGCVAPRKVQLSVVQPGIERAVLTAQKLLWV